MLNGRGEYRSPTLLLLMSHDDWDGVYLWIDSDDLAALVAVVGEDILVALDAVGVVVPQDVTVASQGVVAVVAKHLLFVKCLLATCKVFDWAEMKRLHWIKARPFFEKRKYLSRQKHFLRVSTQQLKLRSFFNTGPILKSLSGANKCWLLLLIDTPRLLLIPSYESLGKGRNKLQQLS